MLLFFCQLTYIVKSPISSSSSLSTSSFSCASLSAASVYQYLIAGSMKAHLLPSNSLCRCIYEREFFQICSTHVALLAINQIQMRLRESQLDEHVTPKGT